MTGRQFLKARAPVQMTESALGGEGLLSTFSDLGGLRLGRRVTLLERARVVVAGSMRGEPANLPRGLPLLYNVPNMFSSPPASS